MLIFYEISQPDYENKRRSENALSTLESFR